MKTNDKKNCWEVMGCGREPGGARAEELGTCPAATDERYHGINDGVNGGRFCWKVAGTFCNGEKQASFIDKILDCVDCRFYKEVCKAEGSFFLFPQRDDFPWIKK